MSVLRLSSVLLAATATLSAQTQASVSRTGTGCNDAKVSFYELFPATTFDLANNSIMLIATGTGYVALPGANQFVAPVGPGLRLVDDSLSPAITLPFSIPYPGGSTNTIRVCSNGFIYLNGTGTSASFSPTVSAALSGGPRLFAAWMDFLPDGPTNVNNVFCDVDPVGGRVFVTWFNVAEFAAPSNRSTLQLMCTSSGIIEFTWQSVTHANHNCLVGFSPGAGNRDPGNRDLSTTLPFITQTDALPLVQDSDRPVLGTNINLRVSSIPAGSTAGFELIGRPAPAIDLTSAGMPNCFLYVLPIVIAVPFSAGGAAANIPIQIPNDPSLAGAALGVQAIVVAPAQNTFGAVTSNLATLILGQI